MLKVLTGIMVVITITLITTDHTVVLLTGMVIIGMHGDPITTDRDTGFITPLILIQNPTGIIAIINLMAMRIIIHWFIMVHSVGMTDIHMLTLDCHTTAIRMHIILTQVLIIITTTTHIHTPTQTLLHTTQVVLEE
jgi:hypothetical protein